MTPEELKGALKRQLAPRRKKWQKPAAVVRALRLRRGQVVAEIGSGPGYFTPRLARAVGPSGHVYAVDPEAAVLDVLRRRPMSGGEVAYTVGASLESVYKAITRLHARRLVRRSRAASFPSTSCSSRTRSRS